MFQNWESMEDSTVEAIRETFLQREGRLENTGEAWRLTVQRKTLDVLVDRVGWGFRTIVHPWMDRPISVEW